MVQNVAPNALSQDILDVEREYRQKITVVTARPRLVEAAFLAWGAVIATCAVFFLASVGWYGVNGLFEDNAYKNALLQNSDVSHARLQAAAPEYILVGNVEVVATGSGTNYDLYVEVENPNTRHAAEFTYSFTYDGGETKEREGFLNPGETAYIVAARGSGSRPKSPAFNISEISWVYISPHDIANVAAWYAEHSAFTVADVVFARDITYTEATVSRTTFTVTNHTAYSYWEPSFIVRVLRGSSLLGIATITSAQFTAGEERTIDMRWFGDLPQTATVTVSPHIPYFNEDAYMNPEQSSLGDVRSRWTLD
jgi:hypothetical protein